MCSSNLYTTAGRSENLRWTSKVSTEATYSGSHSLVWELHVEGLRLHTGGEFKKVSGVVQNSYARLSPERIRMRRLSSRACADYSRVTSVTPSCNSQGEVTPILIGVESVAYRTRHSVDSSYLFLR